MKLIEKFCERICGEATLDPASRAAAVRAFEDTIAVAFAGWFEPASVAARKYAGQGGWQLLDGTCVSSPEQAAFANAVAGHALDYDDVHLVSVTHPSVVSVPALMALAHLADSRRSILDAYGVGVSVNIELGRILGFEHYDRGWHATSTIGPVAAAAAGCHYLGLDETSTRSALALAAAQSSGMQRNFGSMAKPVQAGNAASAAVRAVMLAAAGVDGDRDIFGIKGFGDLFGANVPSSARMAPSDVNSISVKLYPCCYATHRLIAAALEARAQLGDRTIDTLKSVAVSVPFETMQPLQVLDPRSGTEAKFCATYVLSVALLSGDVRLSDFSETAIHRPEVRALMERITVVDDRDSGRPHVSLEYGQVDLALDFRDGSRVDAAAFVFPGSPEAPPTTEQMGAKIADCAAIFSRQSGVELGIGDIRSRVMELTDFAQRAAV